MIEKGFTILVGDANGADKAVQRCLADKDYRNVIVHCMTANCRNNVGDWPTQEIAAPQGARGFAYYSIKDQAMVDAVEYGLRGYRSSYSTEAATFATIFRTKC
jgi:adenine-specific DNA-methyltransferase